MFGGRQSQEQMDSALELHCQSSFARAGGSRRTGRCAFSHWPPRCGCGRSGNIFASKIARGRKKKGEKEIGVRKRTTIENDAK